MTQNGFYTLCGKYLIDVGVALENEGIQDALTDRDDAEVERILREEF